MASNAMVSFQSTMRKELPITQNNSIEKA